MNQTYALTSCLNRSSAYSSRSGSGQWIVNLVPALIGDGVGRVDDLRLVVDVIDTELDAVRDAAGLDDRHAGRVAALAPVEHVAHGQDGLQRVALRAAGRRDIGLAAGDPDRVVEDRLDGLGVDPVRVVLDDDPVLFDDHRDVGRDLGLLAGVERVVDQLLGHDQWPVVDRVAGLVLQFALAAELHQPRDGEGDARQLRLGLGLDLASGPARLCHNL